MDKEEDLIDNWSSSSSSSPSSPVSSQDVPIQEMQKQSTKNRRQKEAIEDLEYYEPLEDLRKPIADYSGIASKPASDAEEEQAEAELHEESFEGEHQRKYSSKDAAKTKLRFDSVKRQLEKSQRTGNLKRDRPAKEDLIGNIKFSLPP